MNCLHEAIRTLKKAHANHTVGEFVVALAIVTVILPFLTLFYWVTDGRKCLRLALYECCLVAQRGSCSICGVRIEPNRVMCEERDQDFESNNSPYPYAELGCVCEGCYSYLLKCGDDEFNARLEDAEEMPNSYGTVKTVRG